MYRRIIKSYFNYYNDTQIIRLLEGRFNSKTHKRIERVNKILSKIYYMKIKDIKTDEEGVMLCPSCGEYELRHVMIWNSVTDEGHETGDLTCDTPDCETGFVVTEKGELL